MLRGEGEEEAIAAKKCKKTAYRDNAEAERRGTTELACAQVVEPVCVWFIILFLIHLRQSRSSHTLGCLKWAPTEGNAQLPKHRRRALREHAQWRPHSVTLEHWPWSAHRVKKKKG